MHSKMGLTHTDLKPENILLKLDSKKVITDINKHPINVQRKKEMFDGERVDDSSSDSQTFKDNDQQETEFDNEK